MGKSFHVSSLPEVFDWSSLAMVTRFPCDGQYRLGDTAAVEEVKETTNFHGESLP
jgi:hypothetical protein